MADERRDPRAEIVAVGSELLLGDLVDTNSAFLSARLAEIGIDVYRHVAVGDNDERLLGALREAVGRSDVVLVTGGLGPTQDDRTRDSVARLAGVGLTRHDDLVEWMEQRFAARGRTMPSNNLRQADIPDGARVLAPLGTAAGFAIAAGGATLYCMPGVPAEMRSMFDADVLPELTRLAGGQATVSRLVRTAGVAESQVAEACGDLVDRLEEAGNPTIAFLASRSETRVRVTAKGPTRDQALAMIAPVVEEIIERLGTGVVGLDEEGTEHAVARLLLASGRTLALAESVTGGGVGARLVRVPGASDWLVGGLTVYQTGTKTSLAGVDPGIVAAHGPVSEPTVAALAEGARVRLGADVGLGVVGVAGPTTQGSAEVGTVCIAVSSADGEPAVRTVRMQGRDREGLIDYAIAHSIDFLRRELAGAG